MSVYPVLLDRLKVLGSIYLKRQHKFLLYRYVFRDLEKDNFAREVNAHPTETRYPQDRTLEFRILNS